MKQTYEISNQRPYAVAVQFEHAGTVHLGSRATGEATKTVQLDEHDATAASNTDGLKLSAPSKPKAVKPAAAFAVKAKTDPERLKSKSERKPEKEVAK